MGVVRIIEDSWLRERAGRSIESCNKEVARDLVNQMGWVARWCLHPTVLERAGRTPARLNELSGGACAALFVTNEALDCDLPCLRPAFALPLRWNNRLEHDSKCLPPGLREAADAVRQVLAAGGKDYSNWRLDFAVSSPTSVDLSKLNLSCASAWLPLAAGLLVVGAGDDIDPRVCSTGCWDRHGGGLSGVGDIKRKLVLAREMGATHFFSPGTEASDGQLEDWGGSRGYVKCGTGPLFALLKPLLKVLDVEPGEQADRTELEAYVERLDRRVRDKAISFYLRRCLPIYVKALQSKHGATRHADTLIAWFSRPELLITALAVTRCQQAIIIHTEEKKIRGELKDAEAQARDLLADHGDFQIHSLCAGDKSVVCSKERQRQLSARLRQQRQQLSAEECTLDLTPGTAMMSIWLAGQRGPQDHLIYLNHEEGTPRPRPREYMTVEFEPPSTP